MANVKFLQGTSANLAKYLPNGNTAATEGAFYLTTDTNRLYIGKDIGSGTIRAVPVNQGVITVADVSSLPSPSSADHGQFYYAQAENVLCVLSGDVGGKKWVQINAVNTLQDTTSNISLATISGGYSITDTVQDEYDHVSSGSFSLIGGANITLTKDANSNTITITGANSNDTTYGLGAASNKIQLTTTNGAAGDAGEIALSGSGIATVTASNNSVSVSVPAPEMTVTQAFSSTGVLTTTASNSNSDGSDAATNFSTITPSIKLGDNATEYKFIGNGGSTGVATLPVYTKTEIEGLINDAKADIDSMSYQGTVTSTNASTIIVSTANVGDTYKAASVINPSSLTGVTINLPSDQTNIKIGDLIIAKPNGSNGGDGNVVWDVVPSGNDQTITGGHSGTSISVRDEIADEAIVGIQINGDATSHIETSGSWNSTTKTNVITVAQKADYTAQTVAGSTGNVTLSQASTPSGSDDGHTEATFTAITAIQTDAYGNVINNSIQTKQFKVVDSHANIQQVGIGTSVTNNVATITTTVTDTDTVSKSGNFKLGTNGSIAITQNATAGRVDIDLVWGSFN